MVTGTIRILTLVFGLLVCSALQAGKFDTALKAVNEAPAAPDFSLKDIDDHTHTLSDYRGKVIVINFWATWCPPCREEMPSMQRAWEKVKDHDIVILAVDVGEDEDTIFEFTASYPVGFPLLLDQDSSVVQQWPVKGLPTTFVVDPKGRIVYRAIGGRAWDDPELLKQLDALRDN